MTEQPFKTRSILGCLLLACAAGSPAPAQAQYRLQAGDVLEVAVANAPDLRLRAPIQLDGAISLPLAGTILAEGSTVAEVRSRVRSAIASKIIRVRLSDGREVSRSIEADEIAVGIVDYKPVFVTGEVQRTGEQSFRPRMTVRQAIISAGGLMGHQLAGGQPDIPGLRSEYISAWINVASNLARLWSIDVELGDKKPFDMAKLSPAPLSQDTLETILRLEEKTRTNRSASQLRDQDFYRQAIQESDLQIQILSEQQRAEEQGAQADALDLQRAMEAFGKGNLPSPRVTDYRRAVLLSTTRKLQTAAQLLQVKRNRAEAARALGKMDDDKNLLLIVEQRQEIVKLETGRARLQAAEEKLRLAGVALPRTGQESDKSQYSIIRRGRSAPLIVDQDAELEPGDVLEVTNNTAKAAAPERVSQSAHATPAGGH